MCGLAGFLKAGALSPDEAQASLAKMAASLRHRGPDDEGMWQNAQAGIALCHRRLAIIDLSSAGHQPMHSAGRRFTIVYNGEIYNYRELRAELLLHGYSFVGASDTEVLLAAIEHWGLRAALEKCKGMFAIALWDSRERVLYLVRDRYGEKPLYFGVCGNTLLFGSELKALRQHPSWTGDIDRDALALMMQHDYVPAPYSIFRGIRKVVPGSFVAVRTSGSAFRIEEQRYWHPDVMFERAAEEQSKLGPNEWIELVEDALSRAVQRQMLADVPVGAFLSGGTDSSLVVALMQRASTQRVRTFSIGFSEPEFDESPFARGVAQHLGTEHTEYIVTPRDCLNVVPEIPRVYDEPFADRSQIPTYLVCQLARRKVTVALSGDGGDELFAGYGRYAISMKKWRAVSRLPAPVRAHGSAILEKMPRRALEMAARPASFLWGRGKRKEGFAERLQHYSNQWKAANQGEFYRSSMRRWYPPKQPVLGASEALREVQSTLRHVDPLKQLMHIDACEYLPDDILVKVDRAAMAVSLETRIPLLDVDVAHVAARIPSAVLMHDGRGKWVLRELLRRHIPSALVDRPKSGFAVPIAKWLREDLRPWAADLLDASRLRREGYLDASMVQERWQQHLAGQADWSQHLWNVLMFQEWARHWREVRPVREVHAKAS